MVGNIELSHVEKTFSTTTGGIFRALEDISVKIQAGSFISIIGPSGCGKSTMLRLISGLDKPTNGTVTLDGEIITQPGADRGFMFQAHNLFPWMSIYENVAFGLKARHLYKDNKTKVDKMLQRVGLEKFGQSYPHQLSGGMCQRASLARALVGHPKVLLLDEPLGALDAFTRMSMQDELQQIWKQEHMTMVMVTHDVEEAVYLSDMVIIMSAQPGRIIQRVPIELARPRNRSSQRFFEYSSKLLKILHYGGKLSDAKCSIQTETEG